MGILALFLSFLGFFSQLFNGYVVPGIFMVSVSTAIISSEKYIFPKKFLLKKWVLLTLFLVGIFGSIYDAYDYFSTPHMTGNYYGAWIILIPMNLVSFFLIWNRRKSL